MRAAVVVDADMLRWIGTKLNAVDLLEYDDFIEFGVDVSTSVRELHGYGECFCGRVWVLIRIKDSLIEGRLAVRWVADAD